MSAIILDAQPRETGKTAAKAVRAADRVPCVLYGTRTEPVHFSVATLSLRPLIHTTDTHRVQVTVGGEAYDVILKEVAFHPVTDVPLHVDFLALTKGEMLTLMVPIHLDGTSVGVKAGGVLSQTLHEVEVRCLPKDIPSNAPVDISALEVGDSIQVSDLDLGEGVEVLTEPDVTVATVTAPRAEVEEEVDVDEMDLLDETDVDSDEEATEDEAADEA